MEAQEGIQGLDPIIEMLGQKLPPELIGFVLAAVVLVVFILLAYFLKRYERPEPPTVSTGAPMDDDTTLLSKMRAKSAAKPGRILKEKLKAREGAMAAGFIVDDVERDLPVLSGTGAAVGQLERQLCARYYYPEHISGGAEWKLFRRPLELVPVYPLLVPGWVLRLEKGGLSPVAVTAINHFILDSDWQKYSVEIEVARSAIHFYWDEAAGKDKIAQFKALIDKLNQRDLRV